MLCSVSLRVGRFAVGVFALAACSSSAQFHPKNGRAYAPLTARAVRCTDAEVKLVTDAGGAVIGTIDARSLRVHATSDDIADEAAVEAAKHGGTHVVVTETGVKTPTPHDVGERDTPCRSGDQRIDCATRFASPSDATNETPTAKVTVLRLPPEKWTVLPENLRPAPLH